MRDMVFISLENWDEIYRRNQFICEGLARRHPESRILFVEPPDDFSHEIRRGVLPHRKNVIPSPLPHNSNILITRPLKLFPESFASGRAFNRLLLHRHLHRALQLLSFNSPILWINDHSTFHLVHHLGESAVIYDITDDWISLNQLSEKRERTRREDAALCKIADQVIVCSKQLYHLKSAFTDKLALIQNGVNNELFIRGIDSPAPAPPTSREWPKPVFGYTGTIHADRVDVQLLIHTAESMDAGSIVLLGPNMLSREDNARLLATGHIILQDPVPSTSLPDYMRAFDVCLVPHLVNPFTDSLNPIKLWEYLAVGKPIVSTCVAGFRDYPELVELVREPADFYTAMIRSSGKAACKNEARREVASSADWNMRVDEVEQTLWPFM